VVVLEGTAVIEDDKGAEQPTSKHERKNERNFKG